MTINGVDVSQYQGRIDWVTLATKARFAYIRASSGINPDTAITTNWPASHGLLPRGAYLAYYKWQEPIAQAQNFLTYLKGDYGELPLAVDLEVPNTPITVWTDTDKASLRACMAEIEKVSGRRPIIYTGAWWFDPAMGSAPWDYDLWVSGYVASPPIPKAWTQRGHVIWQYTNKGDVVAYGCPQSNGLDLNQFNGDEAAWAAFIRPKGTVPPVTTPPPTSDTPPMHYYDVVNAAGQVVGGFYYRGTLALVPSLTLPPVMPTPPPPPPTHPVPVFTASPTTVVMGDTTTLSWSHTDGSSGLHLDGADVTGPAGTATRSPTVKTTYTLVVKYPGESDTTLYATVDVVPPPLPPPPPPTARAVGLGVHILTSIKGRDQAAAAGAKVMLFMNRPDEACDWATGDPRTWTPTGNYGLSIYRIYHDTNPWSPTDMVSQLAGLTENNRPNKYNVVITLANEWDCGIPGAANSADGMARFCDWSIDCISRLRAKGFTNIAWLTSSMGTPDFTQQGICDVIKAKIAPLWNNGTIYWTDMHLYSPTKDWIYKGMPGYNALLQRLQNQPTLITGSVGRGLADGSENIATFAVEGPLNPALAGAFTDVPSYQSWFERRWEFLYTRCGFDPSAPGRIVSSECGLDEGGVGGFPAHQMDKTAVDAYCKRWLQLQAQPLVVNGTSYASPFLAGTLFQGDPDDQRWAGYRCTSFYPLQWSL